MLSRPKAGVPAGTRGRLGGFLSRGNQTFPVRAAAARLEGPPERGENDPLKKNVPPWRRCPEERGPLAGTTACSAAGVLRAATESTCGRVRPEKFRNGLARLGTKRSRDAAGRDDLRPSGRTPRSTRLASGKSARVTPRWGRPGSAALGQSAPSGCAGVA